MNAFLEHHRTSIALRDHGFVRILMNAIVQTLQADGSAAWFLKDRRGFPALTSKVLRTISAEYHDFLNNWQRRGVPVVEAPKKKHDHSQADRRDNFVEPYYRRFGDRPGVALVMKSRENARVAVSRKTRGLRHLEFGHGFIWQYYFYINDVDFGRMFIRVATYFPFNCRVCMNGHECIARRLEKGGIGFRKEGNAFLSCDDPVRLQKIADQLTPGSITRCVHRWLAQLVLFYTDAERRRCGYGYRLFFSQLE